MMTTKLRIATTVTGHFTCPQPRDIVYAPIDLSLVIAERLAQRGHEITYFAPEGSRMPNGVTLRTCDLLPLMQKGRHILNDPTITTLDEDQTGKLLALWDQYLISHMYREAERGVFDLLHIHPADRALPLALSHPRIPTVYTLHDPITPWRRGVFNMFSSPNQWYISISNAQRRLAPELQYLATVYNGIEVSKIEFSEKQGSYLLFVGRLWPKKGVEEAIAVAKRRGEELIIIGPVGPRDYYEQQIKPHLSDRIRHIGVLSRQQVYPYYRNAKALLFPIKWEEPFGLVIIESLASGTPVIAYRRGSVTEVIVHKKTGFVVESVDEMIAALDDIASIDRRACRARVEAHFSIDQMIDGYEQAFLSLLSRSR